MICQLSGRHGHQKDIYQTREPCTEKEAEEALPNIRALMRTANNPRIERDQSPLIAWFSKRKVARPQVVGRKVVARATIVKLGLG